MKHYSMTVKQYDTDGHIADKQYIDFTPFDCKVEGVVRRKAAPNKKYIFCVFTALVEACRDALYEDECGRWEVQVCESDNEGNSNCITFWTSTANASTVFMSKGEEVVDCGSKYDEFFDGWLF